MTSSANMPAMCRNPRRPCWRSSTTFSISPASTATPWNCSSAMSISSCTIREAAEGVQDRLADSQVELSIVASPDIGSFRADGQARPADPVQPAVQRHRLFRAGPDRYARRLAPRERNRVQGFRLAGGASRRNCSTRCSTVSSAIRSIRAIAASASACRSCAPLSNCTAARCVSIPRRARARW